MSFEPASPINVIVCQQCQGRGCSDCDQLGVYGMMDEQTVAFSLPGFIDLKTRRRLKQWLLVKRGALILTALIILIILRQIIYA